MSPRWQGSLVFQGLRSFVNDSTPLFPELFSCCAFHLPTRPTSPFDFCGRQALIGERFLLIVRGAKPDGASRTSVHFDFPTSINLVAQAEPMVVVLDTKTNRSVFQLSLSSNLSVWATSTGFEVDLAAIGIHLVATTPWPDVNHIGA